MKTYFHSFSNVTALFSQRGDDGFSNKNYYSCNLGLNTGDLRESVLRNRNEFLSNIDMNTDAAAFADQNHTDNIAVVNYPNIYPKCDALITNRKNIPLLIQVADCACVFLYDADKQAIGLVHSGWRGTQKRIVSKTVKQMQHHFKSNPKDIQAIVSPCISGPNFEVGQDVYDQFPETYFEARGNKKYSFDMKHCLFDELTELGVKEINIDIDCTFNDSSNYFSYRRDREKSGRMMGCLMLK